MAYSHQELVTKLFEHLELKANFANNHGALIQRDGEFQVRYDLANNVKQISLSYRPAVKQRWWTVADRTDLRLEILALCSAQRAVSRWGEDLSPHQLTQLLNTLATMEVSITELETFAFVQQGVITGLLTTDTFRHHESYLHVLNGVTVPGISNEPDVIRRLRALWKLSEQGHVVPISQQRREVARQYQFFCGGGGQDWIEYSPTRPQTTPPFLPGVRYVKYGVAPFMPIATSKAYRLAV